MQRSLILALILILAAVGGIWLLSRGDAAPPPPPPVGSAPAGDSTAGSAQSNVVGMATAVADHQGAQREAASVRAQGLLDDPEIRAGLTGFKGRVITHQKQPVADCGVRIYRGAMDSVLPEGVDVFAEAPTLEPQYIAGETRTAADGMFLIQGVWPRGFYLLFAGIGTDAPMHQILSRTPAPGEIVDLGDVELPDAGVITGVVLDDEGEPLPGALVRAADLPGSLAAFFPVERFDPDGALLIREKQSPVRVVEMPAWVKGAFDNLPIPQARTDAEGKFRLVGVIPGSNLLATTMQNFLSDMKPSIQVKAGQVKDVGSIRLKRGEELTGQVVDTAGKPVADAEVLAGSTLSVAPVDLAQKLVRSNAEGKFTGQGFAPGKVTVAARRGKGHAWVLAEPQQILGVVTVTLPAAFGLDVTVTLADGKPAKEPRFRLLQGRGGDGAAEMAVMGLVPPIDLKDRLRANGEGQWRIDNLTEGRYTLVADAPGHAAAFHAFEVTTADQAVQLALPLQQQFVVRVLTHEEKPLRNVAIYGEGRGKSVMEMPLHCGRTDADGRLTITKLQGESLRVSADHPRWGIVHGECKLGEELVLRMQQPGSLRGVLTENGKPVEPGKFSVAVVRRRGDGPRGPIEEVPTMLTPGLDGSFAVAALQPAEYHVSAFKSLDALRSPGGVMGMMQNMYLMFDMPNESATVQSGQVTEVRLDAGQKPIEGPTAHVFGSVMVDGKLAVGAMVQAYGENRQFVAKVDESGRFDLGVVPVGSLHVSITDQAEGGLFGGRGSNLWSASVQLKQAEERELTVVVATSTIAGVCTLPDGSPAAGVYVQAQGRLKGTEDGSSWLGEATDAQGQFRFTRVAEGTWSLNVRGNGEKAGRGKLENIVVTGGIPVDTLRIEMQKTMVVKGRIDLSVFGGRKPEWCWVGFYRKSKEGEGWNDYADGAGIDESTGAFSSDDLSPGQYQVRVHANFEDGKPQENYRCEVVDVPPQGLDNLLLRPVPEK